MRQSTLLFIFIIVCTTSFGAKDFNSILSPKFWDLQKIYTDSLYSDTCIELTAAKGLYFNGLCVTEYIKNDGARYTPHVISEGCETWLSDDIHRSDEYKISGDTLRFWHRTYQICKLEEANLILKSEQSPCRFYFYKLSEDQTSTINNGSESYRRLVSIASYIQFKSINFENEVNQYFALHNPALTKERKIRVYFALNFRDEQLEVTNFKISKIEIFDEDSNSWGMIDKDSFNLYSDEISNCIHHFSFIKKHENEAIPWNKINKKCVIPLIISVFP